MPPTALPLDAATSILVVGAGRVGRALTAALAHAGLDVHGPAGRGATGAEAEIVLLAVPDDAIEQAASRLVPGRVVGHLSGATTLAPLGPHEAFSIHPLMTVTHSTKSFADVPAAIAGSTSHALDVAQDLAQSLGMRGFAVADDDRVAYHAAASIASNFVVTLEGIAEDLAATAGVDRQALAPLVRAAINNWANEGAVAALTGPIARGDHEVVARQRAAVIERLPQAVAVFDAMTEATVALAASRPADRSTPGAGSDGHGPGEQEDES